MTPDLSILSTTTIKSGSEPKRPRQVSLLQDEENLSRPANWFKRQHPEYQPGPHSPTEGSVLVDTSGSTKDIEDHLEYVIWLQMEAE